MLSLEKLDAAAGRGILVAHVVHGLARVDEGAVIAATERISDLLERMLGEGAREEHRDLPWDRDVVWPALAGHVAMANLEMIGHALLNCLDREDVLRLFHQHVVQQAFSRRQIKRLA